MNDPGKRATVRHTPTPVELANATFRFDRKESVPDGVRRMATAQLDAGIYVLTNPDELGLGESVRDFRKRCKKLRGLLRMVRPELGGVFKRENVAIRDASRSLSEARDAQAMISTEGDLISNGKSDVTKSEAAEAHAEIVAHAQREAANLEAHLDRMQPAIIALGEVRERVPSWPLTLEGFDALAPGIAKVYQQGRKLAAASRESPTVVALHTWRKRAKYLWYQIGIITPAKPKKLQPLTDQLDDLGDLLGHDHDLAVMIETLKSSPSDFGGKGYVKKAAKAARSQRRHLQKDAHAIGKGIYTDKPGVFVAKLGRYWDAWHE